MAIESNADIRFVQEALGHASISTTQIYTHISSEQRRRLMDQFEKSIEIKHSLMYCPSYIEIMYKSCYNTEGLRHIL